MKHDRDFKDQVEHLLARNTPELDVARVRVKEIVDSSGDPSLDVRVILRRRPERRDVQRTWAVSDQFRTWLAEHGDERFPYFEYLTEEEERDLAKTEQEERDLGKEGT